MTESRQYNEDGTYFVIVTIGKHYGNLTHYTSDGRYIEYIPL